MRCIACCIAVLIFAGCGPGGGSVPTYPVSGKVTFNGAPVAGATVTFSPEGSGIPTAMGITDGQGLYKLTTYTSGDGAAEGSFKVLVYKMSEDDAGSGAPTHDPTGKGRSAAPTHSGPRGAGGKKSSSLLPERYMKVSTTPLTKNVESGSNTIDLEL